MEKERAMQEVAMEKPRERELSLYEAVVQKGLNINGIIVKLFGSYQVVGGGR